MTCIWHPIIQILVGFPSWKGKKTPQQCSATAQHFSASWESTTWKISSSWTFPIKPRVPWFYNYLGPLRMSNFSPQVCFWCLRGHWRYNGKGWFYTVDFFWKDLKWCRISEASTFLASHVKQKLHPTMSNKKVHFIKTYELNAEYRTLYNYTLCFANESMDQMTLHASLLLLFASTYCHNMLQLQSSHFRDFGYIIICNHHITFIFKTGWSVLNPHLIAHLLILDQGKVLWNHLH